MADRLGLGLVLVAIAVATAPACRSEPEPPSKHTPEVIIPVILDDAPLAASGSGKKPPELDVEPTFGEGQRFEGRLEMEPVPGGKDFQGTWLVLDSGERLVLAYDPVPEYFPYVEKRVVIQGRRYLPGSHTQHISATHLEVSAIDLAPGETPYAEPPTSLPWPPVVDDRDSLAARVDRWVLLTGTLQPYQVDPQSPYYLSLVLRLKDGREAGVETMSRLLEGIEAGAEITAVGRVETEQEAGRWVVSNARAICPGRVEDCGVKDPQKK